MTLVPAVTLGDAAPNCTAEIGTPRTHPSAALVRKPGSPGASPRTAAAMIPLPHYPSRVCLRKLAALPGRPPGRVPIGACYVGEAKAPPRPGERFRLSQSESDQWLVTSVVQRLLNARTFITHNSVYQLEVVPAPRLRVARWVRDRCRAPVRVGRPTKKVGVHGRFWKVLESIGPANRTAYAVRGRTAK